MVSVEREPITGVWGRDPSEGPGGAAPSGGQGGKAPLELNAFCIFHVQRKLHICPITDNWQSQ